MNYGFSGWSLKTQGGFWFETKWEKKTITTRDVSLSLSDPIRSGHWYWLLVSCGASNSQYGSIQMLVYCHELYILFVPTTGKERLSETLAACLLFCSLLHLPYLPPSLLLPHPCISLSLFICPPPLAIGLAMKSNTCIILLYVCNSTSTCLTVTLMSVEALFTGPHYLNNVWTCLAHAVNYL